MKKAGQRQGALYEAAMGLFMLVCLVATGLRHYLLFHALAESFSLVICVGIFMFAWNSGRYMTNNFLMLLGIAFFFVGLLSLVHALAYEGMGVFSMGGPNLAAQLWISSRYIQSISFLLVAVLMRRRVPAAGFFMAYAVGCSLVLASIFVWRVFPACYKSGLGLTTFKIASEYAICLILVAAGWVLRQRRKRFAPSVFAMIQASLAFSVVSELFFAFYVDVYGITNMAGHMFAVMSYYLIYKAVIETGLKNPYALIFRELKQKELEKQKRAAALQTILDISKEVLAQKTVPDLLASVSEAAAKIAVKRLGGSTGEDEILQNQLEAVASLGMRHLEAQNEAAARAAQMEGIMKAVPAAVWIAHDPECRQITGNDAARRLLRLGVEEKPLPFLLKDDGSQRFTFKRDGRDLAPKELPLYQAASTGQDVSGFHMELVFEDGEERYLYGNASPLRDQAGNVTGVVSVYVDITDLIGVRLALERAKNEMEDRVRERTRALELANRALGAEVERHRRTALDLEEAEKDVRAMSRRVIEVQETERKAMAQEVHDSIGAGLAAVKFGLEGALGRMRRAGMEKEAADLEKFVTQLKKTMEEARRISRYLWPSVLEDLGLETAINALVRELVESHPEITVEKDVDSEALDLPKRLHIVVYRVVQEAFNNAAKHSGASRILLSLKKQQERLRLAIRDNGRGFSPETHERSKTGALGQGLTSIRERVRLSMGRLEITSSPGQGVEILAEWDIEKIRE